MRIALSIEPALCFNPSWLDVNFCINNDKISKEIIKKYIKFVLDSHSYLTLFQKKITALSYQSDDFRELEKPYRIFATNKILSLLEFYSPNLKIKDLSTASFIIHTTVESIVHELAFYPDETQNKEKVINEFAEMLYNYLFKEPL